MPLYVRDDAVDELAVQVMKATGAKNKTVAVKEALQARLDALKSQQPLLERVREIQAMADEIGLPDPDFDMKTYTDDMWDDV